MNAHILFMRRCLELAEQGRGLIGNGALVGSVLVRDGKIIAEGCHEAFGKAHAERELLENFTQEIKATDILYVNLEPCCHTGKTPPCTDIILERGIKTVVYGLRDPDVRVGGQGLAVLRDHGVNVIGPVIPEECARLNRGFLSVRTKNRPWITLKSAQMSNGRIANADGSPLTITSPEQNEWSHNNLRATHDAILVGVGTILHDDPQLTTRFAENPPRLLRIILDPHLRIPETAKVLTDDKRTDTIIVYCSQSKNVDLAKIAQLQTAGIRLIDIDMRDGHFDWKALWHSLITPSGDYNGITSILVEGGLKTWKIFRNHKLVDQEITLMGA